MAFDFKNYYDKNKEEINEKRREKYSQDKAYRESMKAQAREYWHKNHVPSDPTTIKDASGKQFFSISHLSDAINRKVNTIQQYYARGVLPEPTHFNNRGWRLYTVKQLNLLASLFAEVDNGDLSIQEVRAALKKEWRKRA